MFLVLFATLLITVILLGSTFDKLQKEAIRNQVIDEVNQGTLKFENSAERSSQRYKSKLDLKPLV
jgi:hypothetical protein